MRVRTVEEHANRHGDTWYKNRGKIYDAPDDVAGRLISMGKAEAVDPRAAAKPKKAAARK